MGYNSFVPLFSSLHRAPTLPPGGDPSDWIKPLAELIPGKPAFVSLDFIPTHTGCIDFLQLDYDGSSLVATKLRHQLHERVAANRFAGNSHEAIDNEPAPAHLVSEADGIDVTLRGI